MQKRDTVSRFFDNYASDFEDLYGSEYNLFNRIINHYFRGSMRLRFEKSIQGCLPIEGMTVLDVGCGPGHYSTNLALQGAEKVVGLDFSEEMLHLANQRAKNKGTLESCSFINADFAEFSNDNKYDYLILMGFMDYIKNPSWVIEKVLSITRRKAFFSFPIRGGILGWQRKLRYSRRCLLHLYSFEEVENLFRGEDVNIEIIERDLFVTLQIH